MKVLLAVDSSHTSHVIETAAERPWPSGSVFCVMSVVDMRHWKGLPALIEDAKHEAQSIAERAMERLTKAGHKAFSEMPEASPKVAISDYAKQWNADLIMVGSHGHDAATRFLLGSVAQAVLRAAPCAVEIVRSSSGSHSASEATKILLATDGSDCSTKATSFIANRPWPERSEVKILSVVQLMPADVPSLVSSVRFPVPNLMEQITEQAQERGAQALADARKILSATGLEVQSAAPVGEPRATILDEAKAWGADLIVLGSHGRHGLDRLLMGSVADSVAVYAHCSVEVVR
jgi:nucleotide-binding universal stress UspA family protein